MMLNKMNPFSSPRLVKNNFDLLRLIFAGIVAVFHAYDLSGYAQLKWIGTALSPLTAVRGFFVISGFLIFMSYERSPSIATYTRKRFRRIYPAYFVVVMLCALGLVSLSSRNWPQYFSGDWLRYVLANLSFMNLFEPTLPGVFSSNKYPAIDGSLWTLKVEVMFYAAVPLIVASFRKAGRFKVLATIYVLSVVYGIAMRAIAEHTGVGIYTELARQVPGQLCYFIGGGLIYYYLPIFERHVRYFLPASILILCVDRSFSVPALEPIALATVVAFFGLFMYVGRFGKYGDFSYGVYIVHFPIIQLFIACGWFENPWTFLFATILATVICGVAMWHFVEKRFLFRGNHYLATPSPSAFNSKASEASS